MCLFGPGTVVVVVFVWATLFKKKLCHFKWDLDEILQDCSLSKFS